TGDDEVTFQVDVGAPDDRGARAVAIHAREKGEGAWTRHASGRLVPRGDTEAISLPGQRPWAEEGVERVPEGVEEAYAGLARRGYRYGPLFRGMAEVRRGGDDLFVEVVLPEGAGTSPYRWAHPA